MEVDDNQVVHTLSRAVRYTYDGVNRRISTLKDAIQLDSEDTAVLMFVYDREDIRLEFARPVSNETLAVGSRLLHGPSIDQVISEDVGTAVFWPLPDHLGTNRDIVENNGALTRHNQVDSQGNSVATRGSTFSTRFNFTGREFDAETQLHFFRSRYYDASVGRYINEDTTRWLSSDINLFRYAINTPINFTDPYGTDSITGEFVDKPAVTDIDAVPVPGSERFRLRLNPGGKWGIGFYEEQWAVSGTVSARVRCTRTTECGDKSTWEVSTSVQVGKNVTVGMGITLKFLGIFNWISTARNMARAIDKYAQFADMLSQLGQSAIIPVITCKASVPK